MTRSIANSQSAFLKARQLMPGGVSSPVRAFNAVGGNPLFIRSGQGCRVTDLDGNVYIDYVGSYGPLIVGHAHERVVSAIAKAVGRGTTFGAPIETEAQLADLIIGALPSIEMIRFVNSGTEATMSAIRLARAATQHDLIIKCTGCYHGHADALLVDAGSVALTLGHPSSPGIPESITASTIVLPYNDLAKAREAFTKYRGQIAGFIVEPIAGNMGVVPPARGYLQGLRDLCDEHGSLLIFDEVMTGFRVAWGGAQTLYSIKPDITCLGKIIGGGLPCAAYGGSRKLMERISPVGAVYQAGTLSGNPLAMASGIESLQIMQEDGTYDRLEQQSEKLASGLSAAAAKHSIPVAINRVGSMIGLFFVRETGQAVTNYAEATSADTERFARFFNAMLDRGIYLAPSMFEAWFVGLAHDDEAIDATLRAADESYASLK